jgi:hypothetical protein
MFEDDADTLPAEMVSAELLEAVDWLRQQGFVAGAFDNHEHRLPATDDDPLSAARACPVPEQSRPMLGAASLSG